MELSLGAVSASPASVPARPAVVPASLTAPSDVATIGAAAPLMPPGVGATALRSAVVVGGGPAGLAAAILMAQNGIDVTIVEIRKGDYERPVHLNLRQAALDSLMALGAYEHAEPHIGRIREVQGPRSYLRHSPIVPQSIPGFARDAAAVIASDSVAHCKIMHLEDALFDQATKMGVKFLDGCQAHVSNVSGWYQVRAECTESGKVSDLGVPDLVVVADGSKSTVRQELNIPWLEESKKTYSAGLHVHKAMGPITRKMIWGDDIHAMATGHEKYPHTWVLIEVPAAQSHLSGRKLLEMMCRQSSILMGQTVLPDDVKWGGTYISAVQDRRAATTVAGQNVVFIGDAARTGFPWNSGGANLALTADMANLLSLIQDIRSARAPRSQLLQDFNDWTQKASLAWLRTQS